MSVIAGQYLGSYGRRMIAALLRMLALVALLAMPFGMTAAPAEAATPHHSTASAMPMEHCPDPQPNHAKGNAADCAMPCSAALPAVDVSAEAADLFVRAAIEPSLEQALAGIELEIATPPPRRA